ncbi:MAG: type IV secretion system DNA-binding domain-containing protein, partial [Rhodospirillaceae bacterium]
RPIILQRSSEYPELSATWIGAALDTIASIAGSNRLTDNFSRRIWLMIDELGQANISSNFQQVLLVGRSKGICAVLGLQDPNQLTQKFDDVTRKVFSSVIGTTIYTKFNAGETSQNISELIGNREIERKEETVAFASGNGGGRTTTFSTRHETVPVLLASELEKLGPRLVSTTFGKPKTEIEALVLGYGDALRLRWPLTIWPVMRPGNMPAAWLDPPTGPEMPDADEPELLE